MKLFITFLIGFLLGIFLGVVATLWGIADGIKTYYGPQAKKDFWKYLFK